MRTYLPCLALIAALVSTQVQAQSAWHDSPGSREARAEVALTVPIGHASRPSEAAPRLEIQVRQRIDVLDVAAARRADELRWHKRQVGITLRGPARLMINGREVERGGGRLGVSDGVLIAGGVVLALGVGALLFVDALEDASE